MTGMTTENIEVEANHPNKITLPPAVVTQDVKVEARTRDFKDELGQTNSLAESEWCQEQLI